MADRRRAHIPSNREGRIAPYSKEGGQRQRRGQKQGQQQQQAQAVSGSSLKPRNAAPTVDQIHADRLTGLANKYWAPHTQKKHEEYDASVVADIYKVSLEGHQP